jgi:hypothetical protein
MAKLMIIVGDIPQPVEQVGWISQNRDQAWCAEHLTADDDDYWTADRVVDDRNIPDLDYHVSDYQCYGSCTCNVCGKLLFLPLPAGEALAPKA